MTRPVGRLLLIMALALTLMLSSITSTTAVISTASQAFSGRAGWAL